MMGIFTIGLIVVVGFTVLLNVLIARGRRKQPPFDALLEDERLANRARRREIGPDVFVTPDLTNLPFDKHIGHAAVAEAAEAARAAASHPMARFDGVANNYLKLMYGVANLDAIIEMEESCRRFITALIHWAEELTAIGDRPAAEVVLNETVRLRSDFAAGYIQLADIYAARNDANALHELRALITGGLFGHLPETQPKILSHIDNHLRGVQ